MPLAKQAALLKDDLLEPVNQLLEDPQLIELVRNCLAARSPASTRTGRTSIAPDRLLRCCVLKHLKGWSFRALERELRSNLIYRQFTHFDAEATPDFSTFSRTFALLGPSITEKIHQRVVGLARQKGVAEGNKLRTDTTCVETSVHFPTDSTLLGDGIRVLSRSRAERQKERWFKRALRWRAGCEATISHLKNPFSMRRAGYKGEPGFQRYVGWCVIAKNLFSIARWQEHRKREVEVENVHLG